jgi:hypothetical protein
MNWTSTKDSIYWEVEVLEEGDFDVTIYYTCSQENTGSTMQLSFGSSAIETQITEAHDPPLTGMENDRDERIESYVKDFKPLLMGNIHLEKGEGILALKALEIPGEQAIDFRLMMLERVQ